MEEQAASHSSMEVSDMGTLPDSSESEDEQRVFAEGDIPPKLLQQLELSGNDLWPKTLRKLSTQAKQAQLFVQTEDWARFASLGTLKPQVFPFQPINRKLALVYGDITALYTDAIVVPGSVGGLNKSELEMHVAQQAGPGLEAELKKVARGTKLGDACTSSAGSLPCRRLVHAFCPTTEAVDLLKGCIEQALYLLTLERLRTAAFPILGCEPYPSASVYAYPSAEGSLPYLPLVPAANVLLSCIRDFLEREDNRFKIDLIIIVAGNERERRVLLSLMQEYFPRDVGRETPEVSESTVSEASTGSTKKKKKKTKKKKKH